MFHDIEQNRDHYDRVSAEKLPLYHQRFDANILDTNPIVTSLLESAFESIFQEPAGQLLDLGCGTGFYYPLLSQYAHSVTGIDVSRSMLAEAQRLISDRQLLNCSVKECSALELCFEDHSMDVVHSWDFLHHVSSLPQALREIARVLKPGGRFIAIEPNLMNPAIAWYHARRQSEWRLFIQNQWTVPRQIAGDFDVQLRYDNTIISFLNSRTYWLWKCVSALTSVRPFHSISFRYILDAKRRIP